MAFVLVSLTFFFLSFPILSTSAAQLHPLPSLYHTRIVPLPQPSPSSLLPSYEFELQVRRRRRRVRLRRHHHRRPGSSGQEGKPVDHLHLLSNTHYVRHCLQAYISER
ncbi:hypothetical protein Csa_021653 [Cucumis sativus]|nr:hypothetical protein Csa_021653 [Cucumis sativus]